MSTTEQDIIIVGGGISGAALAYGLSGKGRKVTVLDAPTDTNKASRTNVGLIWCQSKFLHLPEYAKWGFVSSRLYPALTKELEEISGHAIPVNYTGGIIPVLSEEDYQKRGDYIEKLREALGEYKGNMIDRTELEKKLPKIGWGPEVCGAAWCEEDGVVDPLSLLRAFRAALPRVGVDYRQTLVFDVQPHAGGYRVTTKDGTFDCQKLVLAAGLSNRRFVQFAMPTLPVYADKGQVLLVERMPFVMPIPVLGAHPDLRRHDHHRLPPREGRAPHAGRAIRRGFRRQMGHPRLARTRQEAPHPRMGRTARHARRQHGDLQPPAGASQRHPRQYPQRRDHGRGPYPPAPRFHPRRRTARNRAGHDPQTLRLFVLNKDYAMQNASTVHITFDGQPMEVPAGISVAAAVLGHAHAGHTCKHPVDGSARAPYCLMGVCFECLMEIDGEPDVQSCLVTVREGMVVRRQLPGEAE